MSRSLADGGHGERQVNVRSSIGQLSRRSWFLSTAAVAALGPAVCHAVPRWPDERRKGRFVWHADFSLESMLGMVDEFTELDQELQNKLGIPSSEQPIHLFLFQSAATYKAYLKRHFPQVPYRRALRFEPADFINRSFLKKG